MTDRSARQSPDLQRILLFCAGAVLFLSFGYTEMAGSDLWWHIAAGRELLQTGTPWMVDDWSYSAHGDDWLNHEWLADIGYFGWTQLFGIQALVYWKWLVVVATFGILQWVLWRVGENGFAAFLCAGLAAALASPFVDVRPHLYTLLGFSVLLLLTLQRTPSRWVLALLFLVWVNLHGGFFFGLMALAILVFPWRDFSVRQLKGAFLTGLVCLAAAALNPSGFKTFLYPLVYAFDQSSPFRELAEWHSPFRPGGIQSPLFFYAIWLPAFAVFYAVPAVRQRTGVPWEALALTALTLAMALTSRRFIPIYGMSLALMLAPLLGLALSPVRHRVLQVGFATAFLLLALMRTLPYSLQAAPNFHYLTAEYSYPVDTVDFMLANELSGNVFALYNWGGYLHLRSDGQLKVFIDGRADTLYQSETYHQYVAVQRSQPDWIERVEQSGADYFLWPINRSGGAEKYRQLMATGRWQGIYQDSVSWLAVRKEVAVPNEFSLPSESAMRVLTEGVQAAGANQPEEALARAVVVREKQPWHRGACQLQLDMLRRQGRLDVAQEVYWDCMSYFPTKYLR
ncbi:hypothetical protein EY643_17340 [Halioglobus maricola]|uniref:Glycosyltransferase RgtA/B/C/D-like domain-containing protein n=1 Tax=Halioglobus maricola TaxID=2601894 RepID=A0A5P9NNP1_9GAMM|nr:hypothetical protein [Halioglobus maricola]QFU77279.1 hypothetical protein EY643_17340 [Halioglobus maricola]